MKKYRGVIIEESLTDQSPLQDVKILSTRISIAGEKHQTPWIKKWTLHTVEIEREKVERFAEKISEYIDSTHSHPWYADFDDGKVHYIIFPKKIFRIDMQNQKQYEKTKKYGILLGIPSYQVDFRSRVRK